MKLSAKQIGAKQKRLFILLIASFIGVAGLLVFLGSDDGTSAKESETPRSSALDTISQEVDPGIMRLSALENMNDTLNERLQSLEESLQSVHQDRETLKTENGSLSEQTHTLSQRLEALQMDLIEKENAPEVPETRTPTMQSWERAPGKKEERHVSFEIPAGTVLKAVLVSGADCSVAVHKPTGPNMVLLRPLDNGQLPRKVRVPLKGSVIIGNAIGDISSERVYVRAERLTLVERNGSFVETEVSAYVSGEDGREGMRGVVVDRSGQIITRAAFAAFLQGVGQGVESAFTSTVSKDASVIEVLSGISKTGAARGSSTGLGKLSDYYIKRAEQLQPAIQIAAGRVVDVVFTKSVKIGEKDLKKKFEMQRNAKQRERE